MKRLLPAALATLATAAPVQAQHGPETLEQAGPHAGEWQVEYQGALDRDEHRQSVGILAGLSDRLAVGGGAELSNAGGVRVLESVEAMLLFRLRDPEARAIGLDAMLQVGLDGHGRLAEAEARIVAEARRAGWWVQGDLILRHAREAGEGGAGLALAGSVQRALGGGIWLGGEGSAPLAGLAGKRGVAVARNGYLGPAITVEHPIGRAVEAEIGLAWLHRIGGREGPRAVPRLFVQIGF